MSRRPSLTPDAERFIRLRTGSDEPARSVIISAALERFGNLLAASLPELPPQAWRTVFRAFDSSRPVWPIVEEFSGEYPGRAARLAVIDLWERWRTGAPTPELEPWGEGES